MKLKLQVYLMSILFLLPFINVSTQKMKTVKCQNGEPVRVPKRASDIYTPVVKQTTANFKGTISILDKVKLADIDAGTRKTVTELRQKLDQYSSQVEDVLKASWMEFITTPCDTAVRRRHSDLLQEIVKENKAVAELGVTLGNQLKAGNAAGIDNSAIKSSIQKYDKNKAENLFKAK